MIQGSWDVSEPRSAQAASLSRMVPRHVLQSLAAWSLGDSLNMVFRVRLWPLYGFGIARRFCFWLFHALFSDMAMHFDGEIREK